jgi:uncharacterized protein YndB with AHSA1/START domain
MESAASSETTPDREIVVSRLIEGTPDLAFEPFTDAAYLDRWFGPNGFTVTTHAFEFRPEGIWDFTFHGPDGTDYPNWIVWTEISPTQRIEYRHGADRDDREAFTSTVAITPRGDKAEITLRSVFDTSAQRERAVGHGAIEATEQTLGRLAEFVAVRSGEATGRDVT